MKFCFRFKVVILNINTSFYSDEKTEDEFVYSDTSKKISVKTAISHAMAKDGDKLFCVMAVADSDESTFVITHKKELPLKPIGKKHFNDIKRYNEFRLHIRMIRHGS